jgi:cysteine synthase
MFIDSVLEAVGGTPLVRLKKMSSGNVFAKLSF